MGSTKNVFGPGMLVAFLLCATYFFGSALQHNLSFMKDPWKKGEAEKVKYLSLLLYVVNFAIALCPYVVFHENTKANAWLFAILAPVATLYPFYWNRIQTAASADISNRLSKHLQSYCQRSFVEFSESEDGIILNGSFQELLTFLYSTCKSLSHVMMFRPTQDGELTPALNSGVLPVKAVKAICEQVQKGVLVTLNTRKAKLTIILGGDAEAAESIGFVTKNSGPEVANSLQARRSELAAQRQSHEADINSILRPPVA
jgi:hypothetical protein